MKNNEDILKLCFQSQKQASGVQGNVTVKVWGDRERLGHPGDHTGSAFICTVVLWHTCLALPQVGGALSFARHFLSSQWLFDSI